MITSEQNIKTISSYGIWLFWTETPIGKDNIQVYEGYLDYILLKLGSRYDNIHVKLIKNLDINNETPPYTRARKVHFFLHDTGFTNLTMEGRLNYLKSMMIGRHADITGVVDDVSQVGPGFAGSYTYYILEAKLSAEEKRKEEIQEILSKLDPEDGKKLEELLIKQYEYEKTKLNKTSASSYN